MRRMTKKHISLGDKKMNITLQTIKSTQKTRPVLTRGLTIKTRFSIISGNSFPVKLAAFLKTRVIQKNHSWPIGLWLDEPFKGIRL